MKPPKTIVDDATFLQVRPPRFIFLDPRLLQPLPQSLWGISCDRCDKRQSVWEVFGLDAPRGTKKGDPMCSLCWLYESAWGKDNRESIDLMVNAVEREKGEEFRRTEDGRLWSCRDADRILGSIATVSRIAQQRSILGTLGGGDGA